MDLNKKPSSEILAVARSSQQRRFIKKDVTRNFAKFTRKHLCQRLFFNKDAGLSPAVLIKKIRWHRCFPLNFAKFLRKPFYINTSGQLHQSSNNDDEEDGAEYNVNRISNSLWQMFFKIGVRPATLLKRDSCNFIKKRLQNRCFPMKFTKFLKTLFLQNISILVAASGSRQCKPMKTYTKSLPCWEGNDIPERYFQ